MSEAPILSVALRERAGKGASRQARRDGKVPGVVYGDKREPAIISMERRELEKALHAGAFFTKIFELQVENKKQKVLARDVQFHPVTDVPLHVDFLRVADDTALALNIPVHFINEEDSPGLRMGGVLNIVRHEIELNVAANAIPEYIECDLAGLEINDSIHISSVHLPEGASPTITDRDFTIATIAPPSVVTEPSEEAEEAEERAEEVEVAAEGEEEEE